MSGAPSSTWFTAPPDWNWLIVCYLFLSGLAGGCYFLAALIDFVGRPEDRRIARAGYLFALPCVVVCGGLLLWDLTRPDRFWHLLVQNHTFRPMLKYWSPISLGAWALCAFGVFAALSFLGALAEGRPALRGVRWLRRRPLGGAIAVVGALLGLYVAGYTGVMLSVTNQPVWSDTPLIGMLFLVSAAAISAAFLELVARGNRWVTPGAAALKRIDAWALVLEIVVLLAIVFSLDAAVHAWANAWGLLLLVGVLGCGIVLPLVSTRRSRWLGERTPVVSALLVLAGGFLLRAVIVFSGQSV